LDRLQLISIIKQIKSTLLHSNHVSKSLPCPFFLNQNSKLNPNKSFFSLLFLFHFSAIVIISNSTSKSVKSDSFYCKPTLIALPTLHHPKASDSSEMREYCSIIAIVSLDRLLTFCPLFVLRTVLSLSLSHLLVVCALPTSAN
jgi:hypothetical protein